jgi:hypothetical protein
MMARLALACALVLALAAHARADDDRAGPHIKAQPAEEQRAPGIAGQGGDGTSLEIAPQRAPVQPRVTEIPAERKFAPADDADKTARAFVPRRDEGTRPRACIGATMRASSQCLLGAEVYGLEVLQVAPQGPAHYAGLKQRGAGGAASLVTLFGALLGPLSLATLPLQDRAEHERAGDLVVAIDDQRVRTLRQLDKELAKLRPGDTAYLTVIRPPHQTMKVAIQVGEESEEACRTKILPRQQLPPARADGAESYAY